MNKAITIALGGGGIRGIAHIGVLKTLIANGYEIKGIAGTSAGGLVGAIFAAGYSPEEIELFFSEIDQGQIFHRTSQDGPSLMGLQGLVEKLIEVLGKTSFSDLKIPFVCTAVDINNYQEVILKEGNVVDALLATIAVPGIFPPRPYGDVSLVDGGVLDPVPVEVARSIDPSLPVVAVCLSQEPLHWKNIQGIQIPTPANLPSPIVEQFSRLRIAQAFNIFIRAMDATSHELTELRLQKERPEIIIRPSLEHISMLDRVNPQEVIRLGENAANEALPKIKKATDNSLFRRIRLSELFKKLGKS